MFRITRERYVLILTAYNVPYLVIDGARQSIVAIK